MKKLFILSVMFIINIASVTAQTGLFGAAGNDFVGFGVTAIVLFLIGKLLIDQFRKKR